MDPIRVDLVSLRRPVEYQFPNDKWFAIAPFRGHGKALLRSFRENPNNGDVLLELLRLAVPDATTEDFDSLSLDEDVPRVLAAADGKAAIMEEFLKNAGSDGAIQVPSPIPPSSPTTNSSMSSGTLPADSASPGNTFTTSPTTKRSSRSHRSRKSNVSTNSTARAGISAISGSP